MTPPPDGSSADDTEGLGLQWPAIWRAGLSASCFLLPLAIVQQVTRPKGAALALCYLLYLFFAAVAGFGGAKLAPERRLPNGAAAAALGYVVVQVVGIVRRVVSDDPIRPLAYISLALLMATCGMFGAMLERRWSQTTQRQGHE